MDPWSTAVTSAIDVVKHVVVQVSALDRQENSLTLGSGVVLDNYHVLTSGQIAATTNEISVKTAEGRKFSAQCIAVDPLYLVAVIRTGNRLPVDPPKIVPDEEMRSGLFAVSVGFAMGLEHNCSVGVVSRSDYTVYRPERFPVDGLIITDAAIHPGNVGGALVDLSGRLLGMNGLPWVGGLSLALQFQVAARLANQIIEYGKASHPWLGFSGEPEVIDPTLTQLLGLPAAGGVVAQYVNPDGPAARAGLQQMDMVLRVGEKTPRHVGHIRRLLAPHRPGDRVSMTVLRGAEQTEIQFPVEEIPHLSEKA